MTLEMTYNLDREDLWQFTRYVYWNLPRYRRNIYLTVAAVPVVVFMVGRLMEPNLVLNVAVALLVGILVPPLIYWNTKREVMTLPSGKPGLLGEHTITISPEGIRERTAVNDSTHSWDGIHAIVDDKQHVYLFIDTHMAHIIPKRAFDSENGAQAFLITARQYWKATDR
jgi:Mn2+/Fe2+ NRAMP family transporter